MHQPEEGDKQSRYVQKCFSFEEQGFSAPRPATPETPALSRDPDPKSPKKQDNFDILHPLFHWAESGKEQPPPSSSPAPEAIPVTSQKLLFSVYDPQNTPDLESIVPPIIQTRTNQRRHPGKAARQASFEFDKRGKEGEEVLPAPFPEFQEKIIRPHPEFPMSVTKENGVTIEVPTSLSEAARRYQLDALLPDVTAFHSEQVRGLCIAREIPDNLFFEADTSFGKTLVELMVAMSEIAAGGRVVLVTPREELVEQIAREDLALFFDFPPERYAAVTGSTSPAKRAAIYVNPAIQLVITTPEAFCNNLVSGSVKPSAFTLFIGDEGHKAVGKSQYLKLGGYFSEARVPIRLFSATLPDKDVRRHELLESFSIPGNRIYKLHSDEKAHFVAANFLTIDDPLMQEVATSLYKQIARTVQQLDKGLQAAARQLDSVKVPVTHALQLLRKITKIDTGNLVLPSVEERAVISRALKKAQGLCGDEFRELSSLWAETGFRAHMYHCLTRMGKYAFLRFAGDAIYAHRFNTKRQGGKSKGWYFHQVFTGVEKDSELGKAYQAIAKGSAFELLVTSKTFSSFSASAAQRGSIDLKGSITPAQFKDVFFNLAERDLAENEHWYDGPMTERVIQLVSRHATFGRADQILVYTETSDNARFYSLLIERLLRPLEQKAVPFTGTLYMSRDTRKGNLAMFKDGAAIALSGTSSIREGLHSKASVLIKCNHDPSTAATKQLAGRVGRKGVGVGIIYNEIILGTPDYIRFYAGWRRLKKESSIGRRTS